MYNIGYLGGESSPSLVNVNFISNSAVEDGGAMVNDGFDASESSPSLVNVILWRNTAALSGTQVFNFSAGTIFTTSLVEGGIYGPGVVNESSTITDGGGNLDADPLFVDAAHGDLHLKAGSPAIDSGTNKAIIQTTDLDGNPRKIDGDENDGVVVDMGAYEFQDYKALSITVAGNGSGQIMRAPLGNPCNFLCSSRYSNGTSVTLTATATLTSTFGGWSGACTGTTPCHLTMNVSKHVTATFTAITTGTVEGKVVDAENKGIAGATVTLSNKSGILTAFASARQGAIIRRKVTATACRM
jgi:hypothetical protein